MRAQATAQPARKTTMDRIRAGLREIGAAFATTASKIASQDGGSFYYIRPDCASPYEDSTIRMSSQREILEYIKARKEAARLNEAAGDFQFGAINDGGGWICVQV